ncbi:MAG: MBL fold metallo-hydrolase [Eubacteriales bacterium]|nr:MBL fold metallo-hydrolase [Eubacteriales bacterium]
MGLANDIASTWVNEGELAIFWLGQAGFLLKDSSGRQLVIDPYLSDYGERMRGFKRISPKLISPSDLKPDYYLISHHHFDHLDYDSVPIIASCKKTLFTAPASCVEELRKMGIREEQYIEVEPGSRLLLGDIIVDVVDADHGTMAPDAIGYIVEMGGHRIYFSCDTSYREDIFSVVKELHPDIAVVCINGQFGNMNAEEGAKAAAFVGADLAIPCHYWTFLEHCGCNPADFSKTMKKLDTDCKAVPMRHGECLKV